jgi:hypothetical protein
MKAFFETVWYFITKYIGEIASVAIAVRQFIIGDWFGGLVMIGVGVVIFIVSLFKK